MRVSVRRCVGYVLIAVGVLLFLDAQGLLKATAIYVPLSENTEENIAYVLLALGILVVLTPVLARIVRDYAPGEVQPTGDALEHESVEERRKVRLPLQRRRSALADRGIVGGTVILVLLIPAFIIMRVTLYPEGEPKGIYVRISNADQAFFRPADDPVIVTLQREKDSTRFLINGKQIRPEDLQSQLKAILTTRPDWTVFIEGDSNLSYNEVVGTADAIAAVGGHPVLLTLRMKKEAGQP